MAKGCKQPSLKERKEIEGGLNRGDPIRAIAKLVGRSPSTVSREVKQNRARRAHKAKKGNRREANWCRRAGVCGEGRPCPGARCAGCGKVDCRSVRPEYQPRTACQILARSPWVCDSCRKRRYGCNRANRYVYDARLAHEASARNRGESGRGIDMDQARAQAALAQIEEGLSRGLSPCELSVLYADAIGARRPTIYRWAEAGHGGPTNLEPERKAGFKKRTRRAKEATSHSRWRSYEAFEGLPDGVKASATEMGSVEGRRADAQAVLTLCGRASRLQLALLLDEKTPEGVDRALKRLKKMRPAHIYESLLRCVLADNGEELADERGLGQAFGEGADPKACPHLHYCDVRASQQKGSCEKNRSEIRQVLRKGMFAFDDLDAWDLSVVMGHANSNPGDALCGTSPIQMFCAAFGGQGREFLAGLGVEQMGKDEMTLKPEILDAERKRRGKHPVKRAGKKS